MVVSMVMGVVVIMFVVMAIVVVMMMFVVVMIVMMVMPVIVMVIIVRDLLLAVDADGEMRRRNAATGDRLADKFGAGNAERVQLGQRRCGVGLEFEKCGGEHVACGTH